MMRVVMIVGPSHAGKTTLLKALSDNFAKFGFASSPELLDLDEELGSNHRSDVCRAIELVRSRARQGQGLLLVNVGAGQVVQRDFRTFLQAEPALQPVAVWCDKETFLSRHDVKTRDCEYRNNYTPELRGLWQTCREADRLVDTICPIPEEQSLAELIRICRAATMGNDSA